MAKKFGKFLLFVSTVGAAFAGAYYFMKSKEASPAEEDDYEDLDDDSYEVPDTQASGERSYVSLQSDKEASATAGSEAKHTAGTTVEEFFDDDDDDSDGSLDAI